MAWSCSPSCGCRPNPLVSGFSWLYIWFFRGTPLLVQLLFWLFAGALFSHINLGVPFGGPAIINVSYNSVISAFMAAVLGFGLNEGAYMAEIVRAGIISVDEGQTEAAQSLGMSRLQTLRLIVIPQAMRVIIPPTGNETISMLKNTSLVIVLGSVFDLLFAAQQIYAATYQTIPLLIVASLWYLAMTSVLYVGQFFIERRYRAGLLPRPADDDAGPLAGDGARRRRRCGRDEMTVRWSGPRPSTSASAASRSSRASTSRSPGAR